VNVRLNAEVSDRLQFSRCLLTVLNNVQLGANFLHEILQCCQQHFVIVTVEFRTLGKSSYVAVFQFFNL